MSKAKIGLIINPIAGMGGRVGLKGTDGGVLAIAEERGAVPMAGLRAEDCLAEMAACRDMLELYAGAGEMGESAARKKGFAPFAVLPGVSEGCVTSADDTRAIASRMAALGVELILFAGGDGTARDMCGAVGDAALALGIPAGVKIHSAVFAMSPREAGRLASDFVSRGGVRFAEKLSEVMDIDEDAYRGGVLRAELYGYMRTPYERGRVQNLKSGTPASDAEAQACAAEEAADLIRGDEGSIFFIGAGSTTGAILASLGERGTLLGVDAWAGGRLAGTDMTERGILSAMDGHRGGGPKIIVTPIGGQGFIFGRGNQQFSPEVIRRAGRKNIILVSTPSKLQALGGAPLLIDTGDGALDDELGGYYRVITGLGQYTMYKARRG